MSDRLAQAIAGAMQDPVAASSLRDQLRASPYVYHQVDLASLLEARDAVAFRERVATGMRMTGDDLVEAVRSAGATTIWIESRRQRMSWRGTPGALVVAQLPGDPIPSRAFGGDGSNHSRDFALGSRTQGADGPVVLLVAPSRGLALREDPQPNVRGEVVQEPTDGEIGGFEIRHLPNGDSIVTQLATLVPEVRAASPKSIASSGPQPFSVSPPATNKLYLRNLVTVIPQDFCFPIYPAYDEFGFCEDEIELEFSVKRRRRSNNSVISETIKYGHQVQGSRFQEFANFFLSNNIPDANTYLVVEVRESDGSWAQDEYADITLNGPEHNSASANMYVVSHRSSNLRCAGVHAVAYYGGVQCIGGAFWGEVNVSFMWTYQAPAPWVPQPAVSGPAALHPAYTYTWEAVNFIEITGNATYEWYVDNSYVGSGLTYTGGISQAASSHEIRVEAADDLGNYQSAGMMVHVNTGTCEPNEPNCYEQLRAAPTTPSTPRKAPAPRPRAGTRGAH